MEFLTDPNVIYLLLMAGLWISAAGAYIPGTGLAEIGGAALILGTLFLLSQVAVNWLAVIALVIGASLFFLLPLLKSEWDNFAIGGLALQALASFFLFAERGASPLWIAVGVLLAWAYHRTILRSILRQRQTLSSTQKDEFLVGERGRVMAAIEDRGTVQVHGELWTARSPSRLESGTEVVVTQQDGLELHVEKAKRLEED
jgi:membrane-bound serine protease (ClpP class)